jgi:uncharacterized protein YdeI (YjbR/CyaY-like superfamily)
VKQLYFSRPSAWRAWLNEHHDTTREVWLVFYKRHTGKPSLAYEDALGEALCFGWIDSLVKRLDDRRYLLRFMPRTNTARWSKLNLDRVRRLVKAGRMTKFGLAKLASGVKPEVPPARRFARPPAFFARALAEHPRARETFGRLPPSHQRNYVAWVASAKQAVTRQRRLQKALAMLARNEKLGLG